MYSSTAQRKTVTYEKNYSGNTVHDQALALGGGVYKGEKLAKPKPDANDSTQATIASIKRKVYRAITTAEKAAPFLEYLDCVIDEANSDDEEEDDEEDGETESGSNPSTNQHIIPDDLVFKGSYTDHAVHQDIMSYGGSIYLPEDKPRTVKPEWDSAATTPGLTREERLLARVKKYIKTIKDATEMSEHLSQLTSPSDVAQVTPEDTSMKVAPIYIPRGMATPSPSPTKGVFARESVGGSRGTMVAA